MQIKELDPKKRYIISLPGEHVTQEDVEGLRSRLKGLCADAVVVAGADIQAETKYFGLYCEQCGIWWVRPDGSLLVFYPAPEIANAHLQDKGWSRPAAAHLWKVEEFGKEERVAPENLPANSEICPLTRQARKMIAW